MSATCKGCGKPIVWGVTSEKKKIPLDPRPPIYWFIDDGGEGPCCRVVDQTVLGINPTWDGRPAKAMVSHFATCPQANRFSASRRTE